MFWIKNYSMKFYWSLKWLYRFKLWACLHFDTIVWWRPILTELMIFDQSLNFNRVTIIIIRIFYKLIWWFPQIFSQCHETFLILKVTDLRCLLKETDCVRILASHSYGVVVSRPASLSLAATNVTMVDILIQLFSFLRCLKSVIFKIRWDSSYWINITKRPIIWKLFFYVGLWEIIEYRDQL